MKGIAEGIQRESEFGTFTCRDSVAMEGVDVAEACNIQTGKERQLVGVSTVALLKNSSFNMVSETWVF
ncbi:hypothetical protein ES332_A13G157800v1 [Gossypium tomentosum]|uniref:Uncharacterized protein n=1 Tax=Gossypium tomentosum TaxID=34277 RepID=A0A5D2MKX0_GOSTO|nr:hypothetical protein ES332_A13G157800v1 [Gossypium tomentosum]